MAKAWVVAGAPVQEIFGDTFEGLACFTGIMAPSA
jgi:hypothetical protein